jgi:hypothetical protein
MAGTCGTSGQLSYLGLGANEMSPIANLFLCATGTIWLSLGRKAATQAPEMPTKVNHGLLSAIQLFLSLLFAGAMAALGFGNILGQVFSDGLFWKSGKGAASAQLPTTRIGKSTPEIERESQARQQAGKLQERAHATIASSATCCVTRTTPLIAAGMGQ